MTWMPVALRQVDTGRQHSSLWWLVSNVVGPYIEVVRDGLAFPECIRWLNGELWFVDTPYVSVLTTDGTLRRHAEIPSRLALGLAMTTSDHELLVGDSPGRRVFSVDSSGHVELFADLSVHFTRSTNEIVSVPGISDIYVASMGFDLLRGEQPRHSRMARVSSTGHPESVGPDLLFPNGMVYDAVRKEIAVAETVASQISLLTAGHDGSLSTSRTIQLPGHPDGICIDPQEGYWYADPRAGAIMWVDDKGAEVGRLTVPFAHPTSCTFEESRDVLYITATNRMPSPSLCFSSDGAVVRVTGAHDLVRGRARRGA